MVSSDEELNEQVRTWPGVNDCGGDRTKPGWL